MKSLPPLLLHCDKMLRRPDTLAVKIKTLCHTTLLQAGFVEKEAPATQHDHHGLGASHNVQEYSAESGGEHAKRFICWCGVAHSLRNTLVRFGEEVCKTPEEFKAWSQNLGHEKVLTTFLSYGQVQGPR